MAEMLTALALGMLGGFVLGFAVAFLWLRRLVKIAERAYQIATADLRRTYGVSASPGETISQQPPMP